MAGKNVRITMDDSAAGRILARELRVYPAAAATAPADLEISFGSVDLSRSGLINPALHHDLPDGFAARFGGATVRWVVNEGKLRRVEFHVAPSPASRFRQTVQRMRSIQFALEEESVGQIFHELALVPSVYFEPTQFLLHASGLQAPNGDVTLIGGTGGVGKTSVALHLCRHHGFRFVSDDIAIVDESGHVWPNLAFPKIYAYNLDGDSELQSVIHGGASWGDRLNWRIRRLRGADRVRRRVSPARLYPGYSAEGGRLRRYLFITREWRNDLTAERARAELLASLSMHVMDAEYHSFHNHLAWHAMNRLVSSKPMLITRDATLARWHSLATGVFNDVECVILRVPRQMPHMEFRRRMVQAITGAETEA